MEKVSLIFVDKLEVMNMSNNWYDVAQICLNGHVINHSIKSNPQHSKKFCDKCGAATIITCPNCNSEINGKYYVEDIISIRSYIIPAFCPNCGTPYPWTEAKIQIAHEYTQDLENISDDEKKILVQSIDELVKNTPKATLAATKFNNIVSKLKKPIIDGFRDILVDILSETAKKMLWPK